MIHGNSAAAVRTPVTVVLGGQGSGKSHLIAQLRAQCPPGERWALLSNSANPGPYRAGGEDAVGLPPEAYFSVAGGCACCLAGPAFRTTLVRLLRAGPWDRLHVEVDPAGHPHRLVDQLRTPPFDRYLTVSQLLLTLHENDPVFQEGGDDLLGPNSGLSLATDFLLRSGSGASPGGSAAARLQSAPPWPRVEMAAGGRVSVQAESGLPAALPGWRVFSMLQSGMGPPTSDLVRRWPAEMIARRKPFKALLSSLADDAGVTGFQALFRTSRAWYCWRFGRGLDHGPFAFDHGRKVVETETAWRFDNRICLWLAPGASRHALQGRVEALQLALDC